MINVAMAGSIAHHNTLGPTKLLQNLTMTINSIVTGAYCAYIGRDADINTWIPINSAIQGLTLFSSSSSGPDMTFDPIVSGSRFQDNTKQVKFNNGKTFDAPNNSFMGDDGTSDWIYECIFYSGAADGSEDTIFAKYASGNSLLLYRTPAGVLSGIGMNASADISLFSGTWYHYIAFSRRGGNCITYLNGARLSTTATTYNTVANPFQFGSYNGIGIHSSFGTQAISWFASWCGANICSGSIAEMDSIALTRYNLTGINPAGILVF